MRVRSIPPITSTGSNRRKEPARLDGLAHMSIGRYMSAKRKSEEDNDSWDISKYSKSDFNNRTRRNPAKPSVNKPEEIKSVTDILHNYNEEGDLAIIIEFNGFEFLSSTFDKTALNPDTFHYYIPVNFNKKMSSLYLASTGGYFEYKINKAADDCLFGDRIYIPELMQEYDSLSMTPTLKNNWVIVTYKKKRKRA